MDGRKASTLLGSGVVALVSIVALARMWPLRLQNEEPRLVAEGGDLAAVFVPSNGQLFIPGRLAYALAHPFGDLAPVVTNLVAAATIGLVAAFILTRREAIPDGRVRLLLALSLPLLPIPAPGPYIGPVNGQWWFAIATVGVALSAPRRWHLPALAVFGLSGIASCLMWPVFRDRRGLVLAAAAVVQGAVLLLSRRERFDYPADAGYLAAILVVVASMAFARLPTRTRLAFLYAGLAVLAVGMIADGRLGVNYRYLAVPGAVVALGLASWVRPHALSRQRP